MHHDNLYYMQLAIDEALKSKGYEKPNPRVGAILVLNDKVIGKGFHAEYGKDHAEILAIKEALKKHKSLEGSTLYVTLSPCSKKGKTQPCTDFIIKHKISEVIVGSEDPSDKDVAQIFENNNISYLARVSKEKTDELIMDFSWSVTQSKPFVTGKVAMTIDGKIATKEYDSKWITSDSMRKFSRKDRSNYQALLVGSNTIVQDNPLLTSRTKDHKDPTVVIIDNDNKITDEFKIMKSDTKKIIFNTVKSSKTKNVEYIKYHLESIPTDFILEELWKRNIKSLLVEGGSFTLNKFIKEDNINQLDVYIGSKIIGDKNAINAFNFQSISKLWEAKELKLKRIKNMDNDIYIKYGVK